MLLMVLIKQAKARPGLDNTRSCILFVCPDSEVYQELVVQKIVIAFLVKYRDL